ncbi:MAG: DNA mismatch repair protein MutS [Rhodospirillales bacterium]|nr:DNA mismatch repair protein MutS [Rhodospirillales bacterium]
MMEQYLSIKQGHPDCLLFYRMGDFYELFFDDAVAASEALDITLTKRGKHLGEDIAMCGVPVHSHEVYLERLIRKGFKVAVCEQMESPVEAKKRGAKSVVKRDVVRIITRGTLTEDTLLDARSNNYLACIARAKGEYALSWIDVSTGALYIQAAREDELNAVLARLDPGEVLLPESLLTVEALSDLIGDWRSVLSVEPSARFDSENGRLRLQALYGVGTLDAFGTFSRAEVAAAGALITYVELTQKGQLPRIMPPRQISPGAVMEIDAATRRNLELSQTLSGERKGSLLSVIDRTMTGIGARLLQSRMASPLTDQHAIEERLDSVQFYCDETRIRGDVRDLLRGAPDMERALSRLSIGRGGPRDLAAVRFALERIAGVKSIITTAAGMPVGITQGVEALNGNLDLVDLLAEALNTELPVYARDGGFIAPTYSPGLDELRGLRDESKRLIANLQASYQEISGVASLKVRHNNMLGYFVEVTAKFADQMLSLELPEGDSPFIHRQTMANAVRFTTTELGELEGKIAQAADKALAIELELFAELTTKVLDNADTLAGAARALATMDVSAALAELAIDKRYCRPVLNDSRDFHIIGGRHPVVEAALEEQDGERFVANDCDLEDGSRLWLLTGPNMAGKSTFLRQNALIAILAQTGCFVPAGEARIGIIDRLFSRVGAADDLARGRSTFMVEMVETAAILNQAGPRSLVILDEIGRGTATFDGLSIAWAVVEQLHGKNTCRALFATHYHELTMLSSKLDDLSCHTMRVREWQGDVVFLHEVCAGAADRSYGIHVGRLAGLPPEVVAYAETILEKLEQGDQSSTISKLADDLPLFAAMEQTSPVNRGPAGPSALETAVDEADVDGMNPREALEFLYSLKNLRLLE